MLNCSVPKHISAQLKNDRHTFLELTTLRYQENLLITWKV